MGSAYERNYRKIARTDDLVPGKPAVFRSGGSAIVLRRVGDRVEAVDAAAITDQGGVSPEARVKRIVDRVAAGGDEASLEWDELVRRGALPVEVDDGWVWVCIDECAT